MDIYIVLDGSRVVGASAKLQGAEMIRADEAERIMKSPAQIDDIRRLKIRYRALRTELDDAAMHRRLYDSMRVENRELQDLDD